MAHSPPFNLPTELATTRRPIRRGVIGVISRDSRLLAVKRADCVPKGGTWCFPGGHVEHGETARRAVVRELHEELGVQVRPLSRVGAVRVLDTRHILAIWRTELLSERFQLDEREIAEMRWLTPDEIRSIRPSLPSNEVVLQLLGV